MIWIFVLFAIAHSNLPYCLESKSVDSKTRYASPTLANSAVMFWGGEVCSPGEICDKRECETYSCNPVCAPGSICNNGNCRDVPWKLLEGYTTCSILCGPNEVCVDNFCTPIRDLKAPCKGDHCEVPQNSDFCEILVSLPVNERPECGENEVGQCSLGRLTCLNGNPICEGQVEPAPEDEASCAAASDKDCDNLSGCADPDCENTVACCIPTFTCGPNNCGIVSDNGCGVELNCGSPDNGVFCDGVETCVNNVIIDNPDPTCDDNNLCTENICDSIFDSCTNPVLPIVADDFMCTIDGCNPITGPTHIPDDGACPDTECTIGTCTALSGSGCTYSNRDDDIACTADNNGPGTCQNGICIDRVENICFNGIDDDENLKVDCADSDCFGVSRPCFTGFNGVCANGTQTCGSDANQPLPGACIPDEQTPNELENCGACGVSANDDDSCTVDSCINGTPVNTPINSDGIQNGDETDVDCGGSTCSTPTCVAGKTCLINSDCAGGYVCVDADGGTTSRCAEVIEFSPALNAQWTNFGPEADAVLNPPSLARAVALDYKLIDPTSVFAIPFAYYFSMLNYFADLSGDYDSIAFVGDLSVEYVGDVYTNPGVFSAPIGTHADASELDYVSTLFRVWMETSGTFPFPSNNLFGVLRQAIAVAEGVPIGDISVIELYANVSLTLNMVSSSALPVCEVGYSQASARCLISSDLCVPVVEEPFYECDNGFTYLIIDDDTCLSATNNCTNSGKKCNRLTGQCDECFVDADCPNNGICSPQTWTCSATCSDGVQNGDETGIDCGGSCFFTCNRPDQTFSASEWFEWTETEALASQVNNQSVIEVISNFQPSLARNVRAIVLNNGLFDWAFRGAANAYRARLLGLRQIETRAFTIQFNAGDPYFTGIIIVGFEYVGFPALNSTPSVVSVPLVGGTTNTPDTRSVFEGARSTATQTFAVWSVNAISDLESQGVNNGLQHIFENLRITIGTSKEFNNCPAATPNIINGECSTQPIPVNFDVSSLGVFEDIDGSGLPVTRFNDDSCYADRTDCTATGKVCYRFSEVCINQCADNIQNGDETGVDCGGSCPNACP